MLRILKMKWSKNESKLREALSNIEMDNLEYIDLVKITFDTIFNSDGGTYDDGTLDTNNITVVDDGEYQGSQLFIIPFDMYQPDYTDYLMTYQCYGSCSGCDTLLSIRQYDEGNPNEQQLNDLMTLCRDLIMHTIKPYSGGWIGNEGDFDQIDIDERKIE